MSDRHTPEAPPVPRRGWRRFSRFSLRGLLLLTTLAALQLGWSVERARRQQRAVAAVQAIGGYVSFAQGHSSVAEAEQPDWRPHWAPEWIPDQYLQRPEGVWVPGSDATDFSFLGDLPTLKTACLLNCQHFDDADLRLLVRAKGLRLVSLVGSGISNAGVAELQRLPKLQILQLRGTRIDDRAIPYLRKLRSLAELDVFDTDLSRAGVAQLAVDLPRCQLFQRP
ncbi:MAG: hypothetical protein U0836_06495 [Pirellulales bacterium]